MGNMAVLRKHFFNAGGDYHLFHDAKFSGYESLHTHDFYQCVLVTGGAINQILPGGKLHQLHGDVFITTPGMEHGLFVFEANTSYYCLSFSRSIAVTACSALGRNIADTPKLPSCFTLSPEAHRMLCLSLDALLAGLPVSTGQNASAGGLLAAAAVATVLGDAQTQLHSAAENGECDGEQAPDSAIKDAIAYIDAHYYEYITVESIVSMSNMSKSSFCKKFKAVAGVSPKRYIMKKRLHEALKLMLQSEIPLNKIAQDVGYHDFCTFYRNFLMITGKNPSEYRRETLANAYTDDEPPAPQNDI